MIDAQRLRSLLLQFNLKGYTDPNTKYESNGKNGNVLKLQIDNYTYEDEFYGGEPYSGNETIWEDGKDIFRCVYWGKVIGGADIYAFLKSALSKGPDGDLVHRGPMEYVEGNMKYTNECEGTIEEFRQIERIYIDNREVYVAYFNGGRVNIAKD
ncbi:hypothetical protein HYV12_02715 [Candidatus Dojkabacteria bacterium]|nr:hypothetical protein [Candidatus Dojkabacteria bacterium]